MKPSVIAVARLLIVVALLIAVAAPPFSQPAVRALAAHKVYLPLVLMPKPDLTIDGLEVTQAVQTPSQSVPLVENRRTIVRIYTRTDADLPTAGVQVALAGSRGGTPLPGSPLILGPGAVSPSPSRGSYASSFNVELPSNWLSGEVSLRATVDSANVVAESDETNNVCSAGVTFDYVPPLRILIVPIDYTDVRTGILYPGPQVDRISDWLLRSYPVAAVDTSFHQPISFVGDLAVSAEWDRLLRQVDDLKVSEGAPSWLAYYGYLPTGSYPAAWGGYAYGRRRVAVGRDSQFPDSAGQMAAHELGHNFGREHAPCGGPANPDPRYPYPGASIGQYGLDVPKARVWTPGAPDSAKDVMSYCFPWWVSDYTYGALYLDQQAHGGTLVTESRQAVWVRASFDGSGLPSLQPVYGLFAAVDTPTESSEFTVQFLDSQGRVLASLPVAVLYAEEMGVTSRAISAVLPRPERAAGWVQLLRAGALVAQRELGLPSSTGVAAPTLTRSATELRLRWGDPGRAALIRHSAEGGITWTTLAVDQMGGELAIDASRLPAGGGILEITPADTVQPEVLRLALTP